MPKGFIPRRFIMKKLFFVVTLSLFSLNLLAVDCSDEWGWLSPEKSTKSITIEKAISKLQKEHKIIIVKADFQYRCGDQVFYTIKDSVDNEFLKNLPVPQSGDGKYLSTRVTQLMKTPKSMLKEINKANDAFFEDVHTGVNNTKDDYGVYFYIPSALALSQRVSADKKTQLVYASGEYCFSGGGLLSGKSLLNNVYIGLTEYIPGKESYTSTDLYQKGDLVKKIFSDKTLFNAMKERATDNAANCTEAGDGMGSKTKWQTILTKLTADTSAK
jgi:hypothetical protein